MTSKTKKLLTDAQSKIDILGQSQAKKTQIITYLLIGTAVLIAVVFIFVFLKRRKK